MNCSSNLCIYYTIVMDSNNGLHDQTLLDKQDPSKDVLMEDLKCIDQKVNSEGKGTDFMNQTFFQSSTYSRGTFTRSTIKDGKLGMPERQTNIALARSVTAVVIMIVIAIFSVPIIIYYTFKSDKLPDSNSVLGDVNISMVN